MRRAIDRGLTTADFESMTVGMIVDYLVTCQNEDTDARKKKNEASRMATADDVAAF